jgi:hypothetical protein
MTTVTDIAPTAPAKHRAEVATALPPARGQSFLKLVTIELRKSVNTRSGRVLIAAILLLAADRGRLAADPPPAGTGRVRRLPRRRVDQRHAAAAGDRRDGDDFGVDSTDRIDHVHAVAPAVRVQLAKFASAIVLSVVVMTAVVVIALAGTALAGAVTDHTTSYAGLGGQLAGAYLTVALNVVMGAAFGAVIAQTAVAILVYFIAPTAWSLAGPALFKDNANWLDVFGAFGRIAERDLHGMLPETLVAVGVWIVIPTIVGLWASSRREVK